MSTFLYLRGEPGSGKITTARILERDLGWLLCWFHDLDGVYRIIGEYQVPRLMDEVMQVVVKHLLPTGRDIIYVRPSRDAESVEKVREIVAGFPEYKFVPVRLSAPYKTLLERVQKREGKPYRIQDKAGLDEYLESRPLSKVLDESEIITHLCGPQTVADMIKGLVGQGETLENRRLRLARSINKSLTEQANGRNSNGRDDRGQEAGQEQGNGTAGGASDSPPAPHIA